MIAPDAQKHVPMVFWASPGYREAVSLDKGCLVQESGSEFSHDNLFHSMLGLFEIKTDVYRSEMDLFAPCRLTVRSAALTGAERAGGVELR